MTEMKALHQTTINQRSQHNSEPQAAPQLTMQCLFLITNFIASLVVMTAIRLLLHRAIKVELSEVTTPMIVVT